MIDMFDAYDPDHTPLLNQDDNLPDDSEMDAYTASQILLTAEEAGERGYDCIEERLDSKVEDYLEPLYRAEEMNTVSFRQTQEELNEHVADVLATSNIYMEALSSFTEEGDRVIQGTDIANGYIHAETHSEAEQYLHRFEDWLRETVRESLDGSNSTVETPEKTYDHEEFIETAVETGLQTLIKMRRDGETYPDEGITVP